MDHRQLEELARLGGKVAVEIALNNGRRAIGFVLRADNDGIVLSPSDKPTERSGVTYRTPQIKNFTALDHGEALILEYQSPKPGTRLIIRLKDSVRVCGYAMKNRNAKSISLAREKHGRRNIRRSHRHLREHIADSFTLKPQSN